MKRKIWIILITIILALFGVVYLQFIVSIPRETDGKIGIIDTCLRQKYDDVIYASNKFTKEKNHGDLMIEYIKNSKFKGKVYYFPAANSQNKIETIQIIEGLEWMKENSINKVNISLSSKYYSEELEEWLKNHEEIQVYASYNNVENSFDYPAMYGNVIGSGSSKDIVYKSGDKNYRSSKLIVFNKGIHYYQGNSYLSIKTLLDEMENKK